MKTTIKRGVGLAIIGCLVVGLNFAPQAQTESSAQSEGVAKQEYALQPLDAAEVPDSGTFFLFQDYLNSGGAFLPVPYPFNPMPNAPVFPLGNAFVVDNTSMTNDEEVMNALQMLLSPETGLDSLLQASANSIEADNANGGGGMQSMDALDSSTNLWIEVPTNALAISGQFGMVLRNTIEDQPYDVLVSSNLSLSLSSWPVEQSLLGAAGDFTPAQLLKNARTNLFISARFAGDTDGNALPDWWELKFLGTTGVDPYADPDSDGWSTLEEYQNGTNPLGWNTPPAPRGLNVTYTSSNGVVTVSWLPSPGPVTGYTVEKYDYLSAVTSTLNFSAGSTSFGDTAPSAPSAPYAFGPTKYVTYKVEAHYGPDDSAWSDEVELEPDFGSIYVGTTFLAVSLVAGPQGSTCLAASALPPGTVALRLTRTDVAANVFFGDSSLDVTFPDIPVSALTNGVYALPASWTATPADPYGEMIYDWWVQTVDGNNRNSAASYLGLSGYRNNAGTWSWVAPPFFDGREQLEQNLAFLLRAANSFRPFNCYSLNDYPDINSPNSWYRYPITYAYSGFYEAYTRFNDCYNESSPDVFRPFRENYLFRNFVFSEDDIDPSSGQLTTGAQDYLATAVDCGEVYPDYSEAVVLEHPATYEFAEPTNQVSIPAVLDSATAGGLIIGRCIPVITWV